MFSQGQIATNERALATAIRKGQGNLYMHDMDLLRDRYPDEPFFDQERVDWGGALEFGTGYMYERDFQAWATQFNDVLIHHALEIRSLEEEVLLLPGLQISP